MNAEERLRGRGLRVTRPRVAVLDVLTENRVHLDVDEITAEVRRRLDSVSVQAVYDVLGALTDAGLARRITPAGGPARFESRAGDNHHHLVCRVCGLIVDVDCATGVAPCLEPIDAAGFIVDEAEVTYWGTCANCR
jgi:Fur family ferric uptake transcriptional regulator